MLGGHAALCGLAADGCPSPTRQSGGHPQGRNAVEESGVAGLDAREAGWHLRSMTHICGFVMKSGNRTMAQELRPRPTMSITTLFPHDANEGKRETGGGTCTISL